MVSRNSQRTGTAATVATNVQRNAPRGHIQDMTDNNAPGRCADCGDAAYIQMGSDDMFVCAHCFAGHAARGRGGKGDVPPIAPPNVPLTRAS